MHANAERIQSLLRDLESNGQVVEFDESTRTSADAAAAVGTTVGQIAKSLVFLAGDAPILVVASGANRVSTAKVAALTNARIKRADADSVRAATGFPIGGVPPIGHAQPLRILIDRDLAQYDEIWAAAGTPNAVFRTSPDDLVRITGGEVADVREDPSGV